MVSPYQFAGNTPIQAIDFDGLEPIIYIDVLNKPTGFNRTAYANELKERLVQNGAHPALQVKFKNQLSTIERIIQFVTHSNIKGQNVGIQIRN